MTRRGSEKGLVGELRDRGIRPRRAYGQHFLTDPRLLDAIVQVGGVESEDHVLEVGTGTGTLTERLLGKVRRVTSFEADPALAALARERLTGFDGLEIVEADVLESKGSLAPGLLDRLRGADPPVRVVANLPYNIATPFLLLLLEETWDGLRSLAVTVQLEVAERIVAAPGTTAYGAVSVRASLLTRARIQRRIHPGAFWPPPKVDSAVLELVPCPRITRQTYREVAGLVGELFRHRRKELRGLMRRKMPESDLSGLFERVPVRPGERPGDLHSDRYLLIREELKALGEGAK